MHRSYPGIRLLYPPHVGLADTEDWSCHHLACWTATCPRDVITRKTVDSIMSFPDQTSSSSRPDIIKRPDIMIWPEIITRKTLDSIMPGQKSSCMNWIKVVNGQLHWFHCMLFESHCANGPGWPHQPQHIGKQWHIHTHLLVQSKLNLDISTSCQNFSDELVLNFRVSDSRHYIFRIILIMMATKSGFWIEIFPALFFSGKSWLRSVFCSVFFYGELWLRSVSSELSPHLQTH